MPPSFLQTGPPEDGSSNQPVTPPTDPTTPATAADRIAALQAQLDELHAQGATPADVTVPEPPPAVTTPEPTAAPAPAADPAIAELQAQLADMAAKLNQAGINTEAPKPPRAIPDMGELVTYTYEVSPGRALTRRGMVVGVDSDNRKVLINWLPDAEAELPVDSLDE